MRHKRRYKPRTIEYLGCFGRFRAKSPICRRCCAMNLRCAIESDQKARLEMLEEMISMENQPSRIQ